MMLEFAKFQAIKNRASSKRFHIYKMPRYHLPYYRKAVMTGTAKVGINKLPCKKIRNIFEKGLLQHLFFTKFASWKN